MPAGKGYPKKKGKGNLLGAATRGGGAEMYMKKERTKATKMGKKAAMGNKMRMKKMAMNGY